jgi:hypothetical protein
MQPQGHNPPPNTTEFFLEKIGYPKKLPTQERKCSTRHDGHASSRQVLFAKLDPGSYLTHAHKKALSLWESKANTLPKGEPTERTSAHLKMTHRRFFLETIPGVWLQ